MNNSQLPAALSAVCQDVKTCVDSIIKLINNVVPILVSLALVLFIYGTYKFFSASGNEKEYSKAKSYLLYGITSLAIIISVWGIVNVVAKAFFPGKQAIPQFQFK